MNTQTIEQKLLNQLEQFFGSKFEIDYYSGYTRFYTTIKTITNQTRIVSFGTEEYLTDIHISDINFELTDSDLEYIDLYC